jgi:hypothetical protein
MGRHKAMEPAPSDQAVAADLSIPQPLVAKASEPLPVEGLDPARLTALRAFRQRASDSSLSQSAVESAALVWARTQFSAAGTDRQAMSILSRLLLDEGLLYGFVDARRALKRTSVDRWLIRFGQRRTKNSLRTYKSLLYTAGRALWPNEYPAPRAVDAARGKSRPAAKREDVRDLHGLAPTLSLSLRRRVNAVLDLCGSAGARPGELKQLLGTDIRALDVGSHRVAVVRIKSRIGVVREVPVVQPAAVPRLLELAEAVGPGRVLSSERSDGASRNAVNDIAGALRREGHPGINPEQLRNRWVLDLAARVPATLLLQLADVGDLRILSDQRQLLPRYETSAAAATLLEVVL